MAKYPLPGTVRSQLPDLPDGAYRRTGRIRILHRLRGRLAVEWVDFRLLYQRDCWCQVVWVLIEGAQEYKDIVGARPIDEKPSGTGLS